MLFQSLMQDVRYALRTFRRRRAFTAVAVATLAIGIGASTAVFSVADALVLRALPYPSPDRLMALTDDNRERGHSVNVALPNFDDWLAGAGAVEAAAAWQTADVNFVSGAVAERMGGAVTTGQFFDVVGARPIVGRTFGRDVDVPAPPAVVVLSERVWRRLFESRRDVVGTTARLDGAPYEILGVIPAIAGLPNVDVFRPVVRTAASATRRSHAFRAVARLQRDVSIEQARAQLNAIAAGLEAAYPETNKNWGVGVTPLKDTLGEDLNQTLALVGAVAGVLLLIACTNVAGLLVAGAADRRREFVVRAAIGAPRRRLVRQMLTESVLIGLAGAGGGLFVATWTSGIIVSLLPEDVVPWRDPSLSLPVLAFAVGASMVTGLVFGLAPALTALRSGGSAQLRDASVATSVMARRMRQGLVFVQMALASVLLIGAGLLVTSLWRALQVDSGVDPRSVLTFRVTPPRSTHADAKALAAYFEDLLTRLRALPQIEAVGAMSNLPMAGNETISTVKRPGDPPPMRGKERWSLHLVSTPGYMAATGTRLMAGRDFTDADAAGAERVVIINQSLAQALWPGESPIGREIVLEPDARCRVVGLVQDTRHYGLDQEIEAQYFVPLRQHPMRSLSLAMRLRAPLPHADLRAVVAGVDGTVPIYDLRTFDAIVSGSLSSRRSLTGTVLACGGAAVLLAAIGLFGIVATGVRDRRREIGIRVALGASGRGVVWLFVRRAAMLAAAAIGAGIIASYWATGLLRDFLFAVDPLDAATIAAASFSLLGLSAFTTWLSARHAAHVDPIEVLRTE